MKFSVIALALLGASQAIEIDDQPNEIALQAEAQTSVNAMNTVEGQQEIKMSDLLVGALSNDPYKINVPKDSVVDHEGDVRKNVKGKAPGYAFDWKYVCAFTKWTPTNQFLNAKKVYNDKTMTLSRFGFIGDKKECFWGMTGVFWKTPLKVNQLVKPSKAHVHSATKPSHVHTPVKVVKK